MASQNLVEVVKHSAPKSLFDSNLLALTKSLQHVAWVRNVQVWRVWPATIRVRIEEHKPAARWGGDRQQLVNSYGELLRGQLDRQTTEKMPLLDGPEGSAHEVAKRYAEFSRQLQPKGLGIRLIRFTKRHAWQLALNDNTYVLLGRDRLQETAQQRLTTFVNIYDQLRKKWGKRLAVIDMRYPNGLAIKLRSKPRQTATAPLANPRATAKEVLYGA